MSEENEGTATDKLLKVSPFSTSQPFSIERNNFAKSADNSVSIELIEPWNARGNLAID